VAVDAMKFIRPVHLGAILWCLCKDRARRPDVNGRWIGGLGFAGSFWRTRKGNRSNFAFVAIDRDGKPRPLPPA